jgi:hypothetical protein
MKDPLQETLEIISQELRRENPESPKHEVLENEIVLGHLTKSEIAIFNAYNKIQSKILDLEDENERNFYHLVCNYLQNLLINNFILRYSKDGQGRKKYKIKKDWQLVTDAS